MNTISVSINFISKRALISEIMWFKISILNYNVTWRVRILKLHEGDLESFQNTLYCFTYPHKIFKSLKHIIKLMQTRFLRSIHRLSEGKFLK
jgi:hypothetical protein